MAGNLTTVTAAIARTALPTVQTPRQPINSAGNLTSPGGQALPAQGRPEPVPQIDISQVVQQLDAFVENVQRSLRFRVDDTTGRTVMTVVDANTQEVIRQIPAEVQLALARNFGSLQGLLVDASV